MWADGVLWREWSRTGGTEIAVAGALLCRISTLRGCGQQSVWSVGLRQFREAGWNGCGSSELWRAVGVGGWIAAALEADCDSSGRQGEAVAALWDVRIGVGVDRHCDSLWRRSGADVCSYSYTDLRFPCGSSPVCFSKSREAVSASGGRSSLRSRRLRSGRRCVCGCRSAKGLSGSEAGGASAASAGIGSVSGIGRFGFFAWKRNTNAVGASCMIALVRPVCLTTQRRAMLRQAGRSASVSGRCSGILLGEQGLAGRFSAAYSICSRRRCGRDCGRRPIGECLALRSSSVRRRVLRFCGLRVPKGGGLAAAHEKGRT